VDKPIFTANTKDMIPFDDRLKRPVVAGRESKRWSGRCESCCFSVECGASRGSSFVKAITEAVTNTNMKMAFDKDDVE
jgi:hypothetical protein